MSNLNIADKHTLKYVDDGPETKSFLQLLPEGLYPEYLPIECKEKCLMLVQVAVEVHTDEAAQPQDISHLVLYTHPKVNGLVITYDNTLLGSIVIHKVGKPISVSYQEGLNLFNEAEF